MSPARAYMSRPYIKPVNPNPSSLTTPINHDLAYQSRDAIRWFGALISFGCDGLAAFKNSKLFWVGERRETSDQYEKHGKIYN